MGMILADVILRSSHWFSKLKVDIHRDCNIYSAACLGVYSDKQLFTILLRERRKDLPDNLPSFSPNQDFGIVVYEGEAWIYSRR